MCFKKHSHFNHLAGTTTAASVLVSTENLLPQVTATTP